MLPGAARLFRTLLLPTSEVEALIKDDHVAAVTLTGSVGAGKAVASEAGPAVASVLIYVLMAAVLYFRPSGLFPARA